MAELACFLPKKAVFLSLLMQMVEFGSGALSAVVLGGVSAVPSLGHVGARSVGFANQMGN